MSRLPFRAGLHYRPSLLRILHLDANAVNGLVGLITYAPCAVVVPSRRSSNSSPCRLASAFITSRFGGRVDRG